MNELLDTWFHERFAAWLQAHGQPGPRSALRINPPLAPWEEYYFDLGLREDLFKSGEDGSLRSDLLRGPTEGTESPSYPLFSSGPPARMLRENVCQLAAATCLIYQRGWLPQHLALEAGRPDHHSTATGFELVVRAHEGTPLIWVETRRSVVELEKLVSDLRACSRRGQHAQSDCGFPQNHPRYEFALWARPQFLWAVAPDGELSFAMQCEQNAIVLEPLASLPHRSRLE
ncbi:MAG: hypothetical protein ACJ8M4_09595 [Chthoniobacterales bacterium]